MHNYGEAAVPQLQRHPNVADDMPTRRPSTLQARPVPPKGASREALSHALSMAHERLDADMISFTIYDRLTGDAEFGEGPTPEVSRAIFDLSRRMDAKTSGVGQVPAVQDWWMFDLPVERRLVVVIDLGKRHRGVLVVDNTASQTTTVFAFLVPRMLMACQERA